MNEELSKRLIFIADQLNRASSSASMGGSALAVRVTDPQFLISTLLDADVEIKSLNNQLTTLKGNKEKLPGTKTANAKLADAIQLIEAADELRAAQKSYMADRGNEFKGKTVGAAAEKYDRLRKAIKWIGELESMIMRGSNPSNL